MNKWTQKIGLTRLRQGLGKVYRPLASSTTNSKPGESKTIQYVLLGTVAGTCSAFVGAGGGMAAFLGVGYLAPQMPVVGQSATTLMGMTIAGVSGAATFYSQGNVHVPAALSLALASSVASVAGVKLSGYLSDIALKRTIAVMLMASIPALLTKEDHSKDEDVGQMPLADLSTSHRLMRTMSTARSPDNPLIYAGIGACGGILTGLVGGGGAMVSTIGLSLVAPMTQQEVIGTALLAQIPTSAFVVFQHFRNGNVCLRTGISLAVGSSLAVSVASAYFVKDFPEKPLRMMLAGLLSLGILNMVRGDLKSLLRKIKL